MFNPKTLTLIATHHCTAACHNCCFNCSPARADTMSFSFMKEVIDNVTKQISSIKIIVFTGGEFLTMNTDSIIELINYVTSKGLISRIVSNGFWANNYTTTEQILKRLTSAGLSELSISTGDEHQKYVPLHYILNIIKCQEDCTYLKNLSIAIEDHKGANFTYIKMMKIMTDLYGTTFNTNILHSPWIESIKDEAKATYNTPSPRGCYNLYTGIQVNPNGQLLACCGFAAEYTNLLKDGDANYYSSSLKCHLTNRYNDILRMWIYIDGPRYIYNKLLGKNFSEQTHECAICLELLKNKKALQKIENLPEEIIKNIYYRFNLYTAKV